MFIFIFVFIFICIVFVFVFVFLLVFLFYFYFFSDDWVVAKTFLINLHTKKVNTELEIQEITDLDDFSCVIKPCRGSASFGVSKAHSLEEAERMFRELLGPIYIFSFPNLCIFLYFYFFS